MEDITERGRKDFYGLFIVSHLPSAISPRIVALANTQMAFRTSASDFWITKKFGREYINEINNLPLDTFRIKINIHNPEQEPVNARVRIPDMRPDSTENS